MIEAQRKLLGDAVRNQALTEALRQTIKPGLTRVADLGTGTGYLAMQARRLGARAVWACEEHQGLFDLAAHLIQANRLDGILLAGGHSSRLHPPWPVDLLVAEVLGNWATEEHLIESLADANRWLAPQAHIIPCQVDSLVCPITGQATIASLDIWPRITGDFDFSAARCISLDNLYVRTVPAEELLDSGQAARRFDRLTFPGSPASRRDSRVEWTMPAALTIQAFAAWWEATLVPGLVLSTSPLQPPTHWEQIVLPLATPLWVQAGDLVDLRIKADTRWNSGCLVSWTARLRRGNTVIQIAEHDNRKGSLD